MTLSSIIALFMSCSKPPIKNESRVLNSRSNVIDKNSALYSSVDDYEAFVDFLNNDTVSIYNLAINYFVDETPCDPIYDLDDVFPIFSATKNVNDSSAVINIHTFSSEQNFLAFGDERGYHLTAISQIRHSLRGYAFSLDYSIDDDTEIEEELPNLFLEVNNDIALGAAMGQSLLEAFKLGMI